MQVYKCDNSEPKLQTTNDLLRRSTSKTGSIVSEPRCVKFMPCATFSFCIHCSASDPVNASSDIGQYEEQTKLELRTGTPL